MRAQQGQTWNSRNDKISFNCIEMQSVIVGVTKAVVHLKVASLRSVFMALEGRNSLTVLRSDALFSDANYSDESSACGTLDNTS